MKLTGIIIHSVENDGLPGDNEFGEIDESLVGRVAFIFDGSIISGWPVDRNGVDSTWESSSDAFYGCATGITHWIELPEPAWDLEKY